MTKKIALMGAVGLLGLACGDDGGTEPGQIPLAPAAPPGLVGQQPQAPVDTGGQPPVDNVQQPPPVNAQPEQPGAMAPPDNSMLTSGGAMGMVSTEMPVIEGGEGLELVPTAGFVSAATNGVGVNGYFFTYLDASGDTTIAPQEFSMTDGPAICVSGSGAQVLNDDYSTYFGAGVGLSLNNGGDAVGDQPWDPGGVTAFTFDITGPTIPGLRFQVDLGQGGDPYCADIPAGPGTKTIALSSNVQACYNPPATQGPAVGAADQPLAIQWAIPTNVNAPTPFDFCIENLAAVQ